MGLDMYLEAEKYIGHYDYMKTLSPEFAKEYKRAEDALDVGGLGHLKEMARSVSVSASIGYWRKANAVHAWFVREVQEGKDECQRAYVEREQLEELRDVCAEILATVVWGEEEYTVESLDTDLASEKLPPQSGFFFGDTELDYWYAMNLKETVEQLEKALTLDNTFTFYYQSSW